MSKYTEQFKHMVVQEYLAGGGGYQALSRRHGMAMPHSTNAAHDS